MCGEKLRLKRGSSKWRGSPPRVRGKVILYIVSDGADRITPACAGKSAAASMCLKPSEDHPRVCGEKKPIWKNCSASSGSPPRVRGKERRLDGLVLDRGITPACAGKRILRTQRKDLHKDHPRVCGEKKTPCSTTTTISGSPPRVRGKALPVNVPPDLSRITPACAGKRKRTLWVCSRRRDHPRVCGEKVSSRAILDAEIGSPPRVRGKVYMDGDALVGSGITPACAGKSRASTSSSRTAGDHPRVCGEKTKESLKK